MTNKRLSLKAIPLAIIFTAILPFATHAETLDQAYTDIVKKEANAPDDYVKCRPKDNYYRDRNRGWYHREQCIEEEKEKGTPKPQTKQEQPESPEIDWKKVVDEKYLEGITAEKFRKLLTAVKDEAVYNPTQDKVHAYMVMQDYARRKSVEFAYVWRDVLLENPSMDITSKYPPSNYGGFAIAREQTKTTKATMDELRERTAILLFVSGECPYCHDQVRALDFMVKDYRITYKIYSKDYCPNNFPNCEVAPGLFERFNVQTTPAIVALYRDNEDKPVFQPISNGLTVSDEITSRLIFYYNYIKTGQHPTS